VMSVLRRESLQTLLLATVGLVLASAASLKWLNIAYNRVPQSTFFQAVENSVWFVNAEFAFGLWLMIGTYAWVSRRIAIAWFSVFFEAALWMATNGVKSCGCFGRVQVNPWYALIGDGAILALLIMVPWASARESVWCLKLKSCGFLVILFTLCVPASLSMTVFRRELPPDNFPLRHNKKLVYTQVAVDLDVPTSRAVLALVAKRTGLTFSIDPTVEQAFNGYRPDWARINHNVVDAWDAVESVSRRIQTPCRWIESRGHYTLVLDDPLYRTRGWWMAFAAIGVLVFAMCVIYIGRQRDCGDSPMIA